MSEIVGNVEKDWEQMEGISKLEKYLNAYLTSQFVLQHDVPSDECLSEAKNVIDIIKTYERTGELIEV